MHSPQPLRKLYLVNRTGKKVVQDEMHVISALNTTDMVHASELLWPMGKASEVRVRCLTDGAPDCVVEVEVLLPWALFIFPHGYPLRS